MMPPRESDNHALRILLSPRMRMHLAYGMAAPTLDDVTHIWIVQRALLFVLFAPWVARWRQLRADASQICLEILF